MNAINIDIAANEVAFLLCGIRNPNANKSSITPLIQLIVEGYGKNGGISGK